MSHREITMNSILKEVYETPVGHDILARILLQLGVPETVLRNPVSGRLKLSVLAKLSKKVLSEQFWQTFLTLVNREQDEPASLYTPLHEAWWKEAVFYQIYPRSFCDSDHDGIGDLRGIIEKLDYLKDLGVDALWLSPVYDSPLDDNGYDIRDYHKILPQFGTMKDFDELLEGIHARGMKLIMDLVVNHTSDEHEWFRQALKDPSSKYRNYYFFEDDKGELPNNWTSNFSGPAWNHYEDEKQYVLHLFSTKQMDLNWDDPDVREDVITMIRWWLEKGVDGFRMDVINYISKEEGLPDGDQFVGNLMGYTGIEHYYYGPHLHEYLKEIREKAFDAYGAFSIGETPGLGIQMARLVTGEEQKELDMIFSFDHLETPGHVRFEDYRYDLNAFRDNMDTWMTQYGNNCWPTVFYNNHDNPRMISKIDSEGKHRESLSVLLAVMQFTLRGTPFIYQGDEMGLGNVPFRSMEDITDVESVNQYKELLADHEPSEAFRIILAGTRDHARILLPWNDNAPEWAGQNVNEAVTSTYKELISLRHQHRALVYGHYEMLDRSRNRYVYRRYDEHESFIIDCNLSDHPVRAYTDLSGYTLIRPQRYSELNVLQPYEARIWFRK
ncbi:MAG: alpha-glucosidase [Erysipelotrichaceae bacterium]|nr:alpha-glucosidase [Erysipelotrichaceae bacterium]